ncbi:MAG: ABC transporter permease [Proteobacteria bacterium]|nr:ABC transporter permease [Pseudomonadota bacterium]
MLKQHVSAVYTNRDFIFASIRREFEIKYRNSLLGALWTVLNPLALIVIYTVIFSKVMQARLPGLEGTYAYSIYLCTGVLFWGVFSEIASRAQSTFLEHANLLKKINFPRLCLPLVVVGTGLFNFAIMFSLFLMVLVWVGGLPGPELLALIPVLGVTVWFAIALGVALGILNVFFRDVGHFFGVVLQFWFWLTPIVYPASILPERAQALMILNPLAHCVQAAQTIILDHSLPAWRSLFAVALAAMLLSVVAVRLYLRHGADMQDEL